MWGLSVVWTCLICPFRWSGLVEKKGKKLNMFVNQGNHGGTQQVHIVSPLFLQSFYHKHPLFCKMHGFVITRLLCFYYLPCIVTSKAVGGDTESVTGPDNTYWAWETGVCVKIYSYWNTDTEMCHSFTAVTFNMYYHSMGCVKKIGLKLH